MRNIKPSLWVAIILTIFTCIIIGQSCATTSFETDAYRTIAISKTAYDIVLTGMGALYKEGKISEDVKDKAIELGRIYKTAHNEAAEALALYVETGNENHQQRYLILVAITASALVKLVTYCQPYLEVDK